MITVVGSLNMDLVVRSKKIPVPGETVLGKDFSQIPGGKGSNQAAAIGRLTGKVNMVGAVGNDSFGKALKSSLEKDGVNTEKVFTKEKKPTGVAQIVVEESGNNAITVVSGANFLLEKEDIDNSLDLIKKSKILITQLETPLDTVKYALSKAKEYNLKTILNPAPANELDDSIFSMVDILTPNETELEILSNHKTDTIENIYKAAQVLIEKGVENLIVTLGDKGSLLVTKESKTLFSAYKVKAVDTTAAGDCFNGALAFSLLENDSITDAIKFATAAAALTVTKKGAQTSLPTLEEVKGFLNN